MSDPSHIVSHRGAKLDHRSQTPENNKQHNEKTELLLLRPGTAMASFDFSERKEPGCGQWVDRQTASPTSSEAAMSTNKKNRTDVPKDLNSPRPPTSSLAVVKQGLQSLGRRMSVSLRQKSDRKVVNAWEVFGSRENMPSYSPPMLAPFTTQSTNIHAVQKYKASKWYRQNSAHRPPVKRLPSLPLIEQNRQAQTPSPSTSCRGPPLLPWDSHTGAAARAAAAAQNEALQGSRRPPPPSSLDVNRIADLQLTTDSESGIGIDLDDVAPFALHMYDTIRADPAGLPVEIMEHILSYLDPVSLTRAERVSRCWRDIAQSRHVWRNVFEREYDCIGASRYRTRPVSFPVRGVGKGVPDQDWRKMYMLRRQLDDRWTKGQCAAIYLNGHTDSVYCVQFDDNKIITGARDHTIRVWDAHTFQCIRTIGPPGATGDNAGSSVQAMTPQKAFHVQTMSWVPPVQRSTPEYYHTASILCLQFDDKAMVTGSSDHTAILWSIVDDYAPVRRLEGHTASILDICMDDQLIVTGSKDRTIGVWDRHSGEMLKRLTGHRDPVNALQLRGNLLASTSGDGTSKLWNIKDGLCVKTFPSRDRGLACVELSDDCRTLLAGGHDNIIYEYDTETGQLIRTLVGHQGLVRSLHLDCRNKRIISGSYDMAVKVWDARGKVTEDSPLKLNFQGWTTSWMLAAKSDYRKIVCSSQDGRVVIMDFGYGIEGTELLEKHDDS